MEQNKSLIVNKYDILFVLCAFVFFFCEHTTGIDAIDSLFNLLERYKAKYLLALVSCVIFLCKHWGYNVIFKDEFRSYIRNLIILVLISAVFGVTRGMEADIVNETLYLGVPIIFAYSLINVKNGDVKSCLEEFFWIILIGFIFTNLGNFNISSILSIDFMNSYSPFESNIAYVSLMMTLYYKWEDKKAKMITSAIMSFLSFKRLALICLIAVLVLPIKNLKGDTKLKQFQNIAIAVFCLIPVFLHTIFSDDFERMVSGLIGMDLNAFMKGRFTAMQIAFDYYPVGGGLGSLRVFLTKYYSWHTYTEKFRSMDLHCDIVRFYLECTIFGLFSLLYTYIKNAKTWRTFIVVTAILTIGLTTHVFGYGAVMYWIYYYILFYYLNNEDEYFETEDNANELGNENLTDIS